MKYKLLVADIDGTLLNRNGVISDEDKQAIEYLRKAGITVSLSTGRALSSARSIIEQLLLDGYHITFDGALVNNPETGEELYTAPLKDDILREAIGYAAEHNIDMELFTTDNYFVEKETWTTDIHQKFFGINPSVVEFKNIQGKERIIKGGLITANTREQVQAEKFGEYFEGKLDLSWARAPVYPELAFINVVAAGVSKGKALEELIGFMGLSPDEVVAIGDGLNDISLLSTAGLAIAMGNAPQELRAVADYLTLDIEQSGFAEAVKRYLK